MNAARYFHPLFVPCVEDSPKAAHTFRSLWIPTSIQKPVYVQLWGSEEDLSLSSSTLKQKLVFKRMKPGNPKGISLKKQRPRKSEIQQRGRPGSIRLREMSQQTQRPCDKTLKMFSADLWGSTHQTTIGFSHNQEFKHPDTIKS